MRREDVGFDFRYVNGALEALESGRVSSALNRLGCLPAIDHLRRHIDRFGVQQVPEGPALVAQLLEPMEGQPRLLPGIRRTIRAACKSARNRDGWAGELLRMLPEAHRFSQATLYFTLGYDVGVVSDRWSGSVNLAHPYLMANPRHVEYFIIHELHHVGFLAYHDLPRIRDIRSREELRDLVQGLVHLEGLGTYAPWRLRQRDETLDAVPDYVTLQDDTAMADLEVRFWQLYRGLDDLPDEVDPETVIHQLTLFGDQHKLFHLVGCRFAQRIHHLYGLKRLHTTILDDSEGFVRLAGK